MNERMEFEDEQKAVLSAEHVARPFEDGDEVFAVDEAQTILMDAMIPGYDLKTRALRKHAITGVIATDIMANALHLGELSLGQAKYILLMDQVGAAAAKRIEEKARNNKAA